MPLNCVIIFSAPLVKIKQALAKLKQEVTQMDIRIGVVQHVLLQVNVLLSVNQGSHSDWKTWKNGKAFSSQGILNRVEKSAKITQNTGKFREFRTNIIFYFLVIFR